MDNETRQSFNLLRLAKSLERSNAAAAKRIAAATEQTLVGPDWESPYDIPVLLAKAHSEISDAHEEYYAGDMFAYLAALDEAKNIIAELSNAATIEYGLLNG